MSAHQTFTPRQTKKVSPVSPENGLALVAHKLHGIHGPRLPCKSCASSDRDRKGNYIKNVAGKRDGEDRYYRRWSCTTNNKFSCPTLGNAAYIDWAKSQLARDSFCSVVETVRGDFPVESLEHHRLGLLLQEGPSHPPTGGSGSPSLKRKVAPQVTPLPTKRRLQFFAPGSAARPPRDHSSGVGGSEVFETVAAPPAAVTGIAATVPTPPDTIAASASVLVSASASSESRLVCSPPSDLIDCLIDIRARLDRFIDSHRRDCPDLQDSQDSQDGERTRENSLSPEEYIGLHEAKGLALRATAGPLAGSAPPTPVDRSPPSDPELAATLAAAFHSADAPGKRDLRTRAKRGNVVAAFEEELKWTACVDLLHAAFDFLFLAETWFVGHARHVRDRRFVASTPLPPPSLRRTRSGGGLYLLASASARSQMVGEVEVTPSTVTFEVDGLIVSGVYLQPSMSREETSATLRSVSSSAVVLGDVNARLPWLETQSGRPGPPERVEALADFARSHGFTALQPCASPVAQPRPGLPVKAGMASSLTVDHCFVKLGRVKNATLLLLDNPSVGLSTDHAYTLRLQLDTSPSPPAVSPDCHTLPALRFHLGRLSDDQVQTDICDAFEDGVRSRGLMSLAFTDPAALDRRLVSLVQSLCRRFLGQKKRSGRAVGTPKDVPADRQDPAVSTLLYKSAAVESRENGLILPSERGRSKGLSALHEISTSLAERYAGKSLGDGEPAQVSIVSGHSTVALTELDVVREIRRQDASKTCGLDGVHMRVIKVLLASSYPILLCRLFNLCLSTASSPPAWNSTEIHMVTKDPGRPRDADNVRPITLICMHRKLFERLLLVHFFDKSGWAKLHPTQAGFRGDYCTMTNAAVVHHLLSTGAVRYAAFIDLEKAFDMVDHARLSSLLTARRCPDHVHRLIQNLTFRGVRSRVLVNDQSSDWFSRTRGVLQGSPLSPYLFNIYIDELVTRLNGCLTGIPRSLFYADDGVLLAQDLDSLRSLADALTEWSDRAGIGVNVKKCGLVVGRVSSSHGSPHAVLVCGKALPVVDVYTYLGFPVTSRGIDFSGYLRKRLSQANGRASFLRLYSDGWGPAHRLRTYGRYLAPMFEYGAPLVFAWACQSEANLTTFHSATAGWRDLVGWVLDCNSDGSAVGANLCGILEPAVRFRHLHTSFQRLLVSSPPESPLNSCLTSRPLLSRHDRGRPFLTSLRDAPEWTAFVARKAAPSCPRRLLGIHLRRLRWSALLRTCSLRHLTRLTARSRSTSGLFGADCAFLAPLKHQHDFIRYRMGRFGLGKICVCDPNVVFRRGHENCKRLPRLVQLSGAERRKKSEMAKELSVGTSANFTDIDFLLNLRQYRRAGRSLAAIRGALGQVYSERMELCDDPTSIEPTGCPEATRPRDLTPSDGMN